MHIFQHGLTVHAFIYFKPHLQNELLHDKFPATYILCSKLKQIVSTEASQIDALVNTSEYTIMIVSADVCFHDHLSCVWSCVFRLVIGDSHFFSTPPNSL